MVSMAQSAELDERTEKSQDTSKHLMLLQQITDGPQILTHRLG